MKRPLSPAFLRSFERLGRLVGREGLEKLQRAKVAIVGLGGVGSWAAEALVRSGVGLLWLVDFDCVQESNLNRQLVALAQNVGQLKCQALAQRLSSISPWTKLQPLTMVYSPATAAQFWALQPPLVLDCIDNITYKCHLLDWAYRHKIAIITSTGAGGRWDPTQVRVCDLSHTKVDPMATQVRKKLRKDYAFPANKSFHIPAVYSPETPAPPRELELPAPDLEKLETRPGQPHYEDPDVYEEVERYISGAGRHAPSCGTASFVTGAFGLAAAQQIVQLILQAPLGAESYWR